MSKEKFILVSLKEEESKKLAQIVSNDTSRKILDYLAEKEATESELAEKLQIPISTVHYNLQGLAKGRLVEAEEFHYSQKGKEVLHYKIANKYIIIAPKNTFGLREKLRHILPVFIVAIAASAVIAFRDFFSNSSIQKAATFGAMQDARIAESAPKAMAMMAETAPVVQQSAWQLFIQSPASWFLIGCVFTLVLIIVVEYISYKKNK